MKKVMVMLFAALFVSACGGNAVKKQPAPKAEIDVYAFCVEDCADGICEDECLVIVEKFPGKKMHKGKKGRGYKCNNCKPFKKTPCMKPMPVKKVAPVKKQVKHEDFSHVAAVKNTEAGATITFNTPIRFNTNSDVMHEDSAKEVSKVANVLSTKYMDADITVNGYTDDTGEAAYNQLLSEKRANAVAEAMVKEGVNPNKIGAKGYGEAHPIESNASAAGRAANRRVEIEIVTK